MELSGQEMVEGPSEEAGPKFEKTNTQHPPTVLPRFRALALLCTTVAYFLFAFDNTVIANLRPAMILALGNIDNDSSIAKLPILSISFNLASTSTNLLWAQLYRTVSPKYLLCTALVIFEIGSALCGAAPTLDVMIVGRAIGGIGGGGLYLGVLTVMNALTELKERPKFFGLLGVMYALGILLGPIVGGAFAVSSPTWRWAFYISLPIGAAVLPVYVFIIPNLSPKKPSSMRKRLNDIDWLGTSLFMAAVAGLDLFPTMGGSIYSWSDSRTIGLTVLFGSGVAAFVAQQYASFTIHPDNRLFPVKLSHDPQMLILFVQVLLASCAMLIPLYFIPLQLQFVAGDSALLAGAKLSAYIGTLAISSYVGGHVFSKIPIYMPYCLLGNTLALAGGIALRFANIDRSGVYLVWSSVLVSVGTGMYIQLGFVVAQSKVAAGSVATATSFSKFCGRPDHQAARAHIEDIIVGIAQVGGITLGLVTANSVFINLAIEGVTAELPHLPRSAIVNTVAGVDSSVLQSLAGPVRDNVLARIVSAIQTVWYIVIVANAIGLFLSMFIKRERLGTAPIE